MKGKNNKLIFISSLPSVLYTRKDLWSWWENFSRKIFTHEEITTQLSGRKKRGLNEIYDGKILNFEGGKYSIFKVQQQLENWEKSNNEYFVINRHFTTKQQIGWLEWKFI